MTMPEYDYGQWTTPEAQAEIEAERQAGQPEPSPMPEPVAYVPPPKIPEIPKPSNVEVVSATTGADKYVVKVDGIQKLMSESQVNNLGAKIPDTIKLDNDVHQEIKTGATEEQAYEKVVGAYEAKKLGMSLDEYQKAQLPHGIDVEPGEYIQKFADKYGLTLTVAAETLQRYYDNPDAKEFQSLNKWEKRDLDLGLSNVMGYATSYAWDKINEATKKNPSVLKTVWDNNGNQTNVLNIEEAVKSGITDPEIYKLAGFDVTKSDISKAKETPPKLTADQAELLKESEQLDALHKNDAESARLVVESNNKKLDQFNSENITLGNKYMARSEFEKLDSKYQKIALSDGFDAMEASIKQDENRQNSALDSLKFAENKDGTYDFDKLASYARTHQDAQQTFKEAGFVDLDKLNKEIEQYNNAPVNIETFRERYFQDKGWGQPPSTMTLKSVSNETQSRMIEANKAYDNKYGFGTRALSSFSYPLSFVFPPARAMQPDVTLKDISGLEWAIGVAQVGLFAIPAVGGVVGKVAGSTAGRLTGAGIGAAAGGVFTYDTVQNWSVMTPTERGIAVAMDTLILGGVAFAAAGTIPKVGTAVDSAKGKASASISKVIKGEGGGSFEIKAKEVQTTIKEAQKAMTDRDIDALRRAGEKLQAQGKAIPKEQGGEVISAKGKFIQDKAAEIVKIAEKRLTVKQAGDLTERLGNNAEFIESPGQRVIAEYQKIESDIAKTRKEIQSNQSLLNKAESEAQPRKVEKSNLTKAEIEAEKVKLTQQISRDNVQLYELQNKGGEFRDQQALSEQIRQAREELAKLETKAEGINTGKLQQVAKDNLKRLNQKLAEQVKSRGELLSSDEATKLWGTKYAGQEKPREPLERGKSPEKGRGGTTTIEKVDKKVEVKPKTEVKDKIKQVEPDIDKLKKAKEKIEQEKKVREETKPAEKEKTKTTTRTSTTTEEPFTINQPKTSSYVGLVWENGRVFAKEIQPEELQKGRISEWSKVGVSSQTGAQTEIQRRYEELLSTMTKAAALKKLAEEYPDSKSYPVVFAQTRVQTQPQARTEQVQQTRTQVSTQKETKTQQREKIAPKTATESPKPQPVPKPQPKPKPEIKTEIKIKEKQRTKILPNKTSSDEEKRAFLKTVSGIVARRRGMLNGKAVYHVNYWPYKPENRIILLGEPPEGIRPAEGKGSVQDSATLISGIPPKKPIFSNTGAVDDVISSGGGRIITIRSIKDREVKRKYTPKNADEPKYDYRIPNKRRPVNIPKPHDLGSGVEETRYGRHIRL